VLEVATICIQTGLNPVRHILESPCQYIRCHCLNFFGDVCFQGVYGSWFVLVKLKFYHKIYKVAKIQSFFGDCVISNGLWPPRLPDLTPPDYFLWGYPN
jgi:hypothetical protein